MCVAGWSTPDRVSASATPARPPGEVSVPPAESEAVLACLPVAFPNSAAVITTACGFDWIPAPLTIIEYVPAGPPRRVIDLRAEAQGWERLLEFGRRRAYR
jgi:hypothetical protein